MGKPVFISYARRASRDVVLRLYAALGAEQVFLDSGNIEDGDRFPRVLAEAVLDARVVVVFGGPAYLSRWYCLRELKLALFPLDVALRGDAATLKESVDQLLHHIVVALPDDPSGSDWLDSLPPQIRTRSWPTAGESDRLSQLVRERLTECRRSVRDRAGHGPEVDSALATLLDESELPPAAKVGSDTPQYLRDLPPTLDESFVGRATDLWRLHFLLSTMRGGFSWAAPAVALHAMGGFGKTRLAAEYVWRFGHQHYSGGMFWIDAEATFEDATQTFHAILKTLHPQTPDLPTFLKDNRDARSELGDELRRLSGTAPVLYVIDNVPVPAGNATPKGLAHWCPALGSVTVLATSRLALGLSRDIKELAVDVLDHDSALRLLTLDTVRRQLSDSDWGRIVEWVGRLPLALRRAACGTSRASGKSPSTPKTN